MSLFEKVTKDLESAFRTSETIRVGTLRLLVAAMHNREIEKHGKGKDAALSDEEVLELIGKEAKKRKEAIELYIKGGRKDLADKEAAELKILEVYLPAQMSEAEVKKIIQGVVSKMKGETNFGKIMGEAMKALKGKADAKVVSDLLKAELS